MDTITVVGDVIVAIVVFVVTAANAHKAGAGSRKVWGGGILLSLYVLSIPLSTLVRLAGYREVESRVDWSVLLIVLEVSYYASLAVAWALLITGTALLIAGAKKAARGREAMPTAPPLQPHSYGPVGGYPQQPAPLATAMAPQVLPANPPAPSSPSPGTQDPSI